VPQVDEPQARGKRGARTLKLPVAGAIVRCIAVLALVSLHGPLSARNLPGLISYRFSASESKLIPGSSDACSGVIAAADQLGALALVAQPYSNGFCYNWPAYAHSDYLVERGTISAGAGLPEWPAYRIHEPRNKATSFLASRHALYYRFPTREDYTVYSFQGGLFTAVATVPAAQTNPSSFVPVPAANPLSVSGVLGHMTYVAVPSSTRLSAYTELAPGVEGARIDATPFGDILRYRYRVEGAPFDTANDYTAGPGTWQNRYSDKRRFFLLKDSSGGPGVVWQDQQDLSIHLTWFGVDLVSPSTVHLANPNLQQLAAATGDGAGNVYFLTVESGSAGDGITPRAAALTKAGPGGGTLASVALDTSKTTGLNLYSFSDFANSASLTHLAGKLGLILGRTMTRSGDGLNHQGAIGVVFNANSLALERNLGQTSGHSFESVLTNNSRGEFLGIDLGDNYPRGIHLHKFTSTGRRSRVVSSFKTQHGTTATSPAGVTYPVYAEISTPETTYYRWSNDNNTYTELGAVLENALGYSVSFIGEPNSAGRLLDNGEVGSYHNNPRNIGLVTVVPNFENAANIAAMVVTEGLSETGGFYTFGGGWSALANAGVVWLTDYQSMDENASRLKTSLLGDGSLLLLWETWTATKYITTRAMTVDPRGTVIHEEIDLGTRVRLQRRDDPMVVGDMIYLVTGLRGDQTIELTAIHTGAAPRPLLVTSIRRRTDGTEITWNSIRGKEYAVEYSSTLDEWVELAPVPSEGAETSYTDTDPVRFGRPSGWYRIRQH
jgi:hypothetical protein